MALARGNRLGPYEIVGLIGVGGMGEVYRARDDRLDRDVAIKVLPSSFSSDENRLRRFEHEARSAGALNHPNIVAIYDVGKHEGAPYLVSELLTGETLRQKLSQAPLSIRRVLEYAPQIVHGLDAAHEKGIVHRDLKPENIFVTKEGTVKILDFGLAKLIEPETVTDQVTQAPTATHQTQTGVLLGTVAYMSPEQARGESVDQRSDIFSLGTILYEMLAGKRPFSGNSGVELMNAILKEEPADLADSSAATSPSLNRIVQRCLQKDPDQRFQSARDLGFALEAVSGSTESRMQTLSVSKWKRRSVNASFAVALLTTLLATIFATAYFRLAHQPQHTIRSLILAPPGSEFMGAALSPDGTRLTFIALGSLWVRSLDTLAPVKLSTSMDYPYHPFWSPDGKYVGFFADGKLKKVPASGGPPEIICDAPEPRGGSWNQNGIIIFAPKPEDGIYSVSSDGGNAKQITQLNTAQHQFSHRWPSFLPDGKHFLFYVYGAEQERGVYLGSLESPEVKRVMAGDSVAQFHDQYLWFVRDGALMAQPFDLRNFTLKEEPTRIADGVDYIKALGISGFSVSQNDSLIYFNKQPPQKTRISIIDDKEKELARIADYDNVDGVHISHDGQKILLNRTNQPSEDSDLWIYELSHGLAERFTFHPAQYFSPIWSWDGKSVLFSTVFNGITEIYRKATNGSGNDELVLQSKISILPCDVTPDGKFLIYQQRNPQTTWNLLVLPMSGVKTPRVFLQTPFSEQNAHISPDGKWVAYTSNKSGRDELYVRPFEDPSAGEFQVSTGGMGTVFRWRSDGKKIFFGSPKGLMSVDVQSTGNDFQTGIPHNVFPAEPDVVAGDIFPDGLRFLSVKAVENEHPPASMTLVVNWKAELNRN